MENCIDASIQGLTDYIKNCISGNISTNKKKNKKQGNRNGKKNNYMDILMQQQTCTQDVDMATKRKSQGYIKAKINNMQQNSKCRLCRERDETINHIVSECSKQTQKKYKTRHDWVGKVIYWELCKILNFDNNIKWYTHKPESVLENEIYRILWDFEIQIIIMSCHQHRSP